MPYAAANLYFEKELNQEKVARRMEVSRPSVSKLLERVMNSAGKPHRNANVSVSSVLRRSPVFRISKPFLSKFITASRMPYVRSTQNTLLLVLFR